MITSGLDNQFRILNEPLKKWVYATNSNFLNPLFLQPDVVDLWYLKIWILFDQIVKVWKKQRLTPSCCKIIGFKIEVWEVNFFKFKLFKSYPHLLIFSNFVNSFILFKYFVLLLYFRSGYIAILLQWDLYWYYIQACPGYPKKDKTSEISVLKVFSPNLWFSAAVNCYSCRFSRSSLNHHHLLVTLYVCWLIIKENRIYIRVEFSLGMNFFSPFQPELQSVQIM